MHRFRWKMSVGLLSLAIGMAATMFMETMPAARAQEQTPQARGRAGRRGGGADATVLKANVAAHWFDNNTKFWYHNELAGGASEFILVDTAADPARKPAFDQEKLAAALAKASGQAVDATHLPFTAIEFIDGGKSVRFTVGGKSWKCDLSTYEVTASAEAPVIDTPRPIYFRRPQGGNQRVGLGEDEEETFASPQTEPATTTPAAAADAGGRGRRGAGRGAGGRGFGGPPTGPVASPDGKWSAVVRNYNIYLTSVADGKETQLTNDGSEGDYYTRLAWARDSGGLVAYRLQPGDRLPVYRILSSPPGQNGASGGGVGRVVLQTTDYYALAGDKFDAYELNVFDPATQKQIKPEMTRVDMSAGGGDPQAPVPRWRADGYHFWLEKYDRGHQRYRLIEVNAHTGEIRNIIDEQSKTFIWSAHREGLEVQNPLDPQRPLEFQVLNPLSDPNQLIYVSEMSGYRHMYMVDAAAGKMTQIDKGDWPVRFVDYIDQDAKVIWFMANGIYPGQDPLFMHYGHINFDGTGLVWMTEGNGMHRAEYSADYKYIIDTYSRVDMPPVTELRRTSDGKLITVLEKAEVAGTANPLEAFTAMGRDGKTEIWGTIARPRNLDPTQKYPIIENIYAGPQGSESGSFVPKRYAAAPGGGDGALCNLGFIVVHIDGMGTPGRSKAFHDVCWQNLKDGGFPDRIAWIKAAAAKYPYMDVDHVGIFGTSAGGQNAAAAVLFYSDFYKVAVANSGCHDNRMDKASWNEQWMGCPVGPQYSASSNIDHAGNLVGHLQLVLGEVDSNVPIESTLRFVNALERAHKDFEFVMVPGANHGAQNMGETIVQTKLQDFFVRYLQGKEPPDHNAANNQRAAL